MIDFLTTFSVAGDFGGRGERLLLAVRQGGGGRHAHGPADQAAPRLRLRHLRERGDGGQSVRDPLPHHQEQEGDTVMTRDVS